MEFKKVVKVWQIVYTNEDGEIRWREFFTEEEVEHFIDVLERREKRDGIKRHYMEQAFYREVLED